MYNASSSQGSSQQGPQSGRSDQTNSGNQSKQDGEVTDVDFEEVK
jgi:molecular chaperone DnaK